MTTFLKGWTATTSMLDRNTFDELPAASRRALALVCKGCQPVADYEAAWAAKGHVNGHVTANAPHHFVGRAMLGMAAAARVKRAGCVLLKQAVKQHVTYGCWGCNMAYFHSLPLLTTGGRQSVTCRGYGLLTSAAPRV